jgi:hypothetical protein
MITAQQIEEYAEQIAKAGFEIAFIESLIGHLGEGTAEFHAVFDRAVAIGRAEADAWEALLRLAYAAGMPAGEKPILWLMDRGLVEQLDDGGLRFKEAGPEAAT